MSLKPQDVLLLLKLISIGNRHWSYNELALELGLSPSQVHASVARAIKAKLAYRNDSTIRVNGRNLGEFISCCIQYLFIPETGGLTRGVPTSIAAPPMKAEFSLGEEPVPVWPDSEGGVRGESFLPIHKAAPVAARNDPQLYELLALVDAIRGGRAREKEFAIGVLNKKLKAYGKST